jgi:hypothetical protein
VGSEFQVNTYTTGLQDNPAVAAAADGGFVVSWRSSGQDGSASGIFAQRYDSAGAAVDGEFQVNTYTPDAQYSPAVTGDADGNFVVVWGSNTQDGQATGVFGQAFSLCGNGLISQGETCDPPDDGACPGECLPTCRCPSDVPALSPLGRLLVAGLLALTMLWALRHRGRRHRGAWPS